MHDDDGDDDHADYEDAIDNPHLSHFSPEQASDDDYSTEPPSFKESAQGMSRNGLVTSSSIYETAMSGPNNPFVSIIPEELLARVNFAANCWKTLHHDAIPSYQDFQKCFATIQPGVTIKAAMTIKHDLHRGEGARKLFINLCQSNRIIPYNTSPEEVVAEEKSNSVSCRFPLIVSEAVQSINGKDGKSCVIVDVIISPDHLKQLISSEKVTPRMLYMCWFIIPHSNFIEQMLRVVFDGIAKCYPSWEIHSSHYRILRLSRQYKYANDLDQSNPCPIYIPPDAEHWFHESCIIHSFPYCSLIEHLFLTQFHTESTWHSPAAPAINGEDCTGSNAHCGKCQVFLVRNDVHLQARQHNKVEFPPLLCAARRRLFCQGPTKADETSTSTSIETCDVPTEPLEPQHEEELEDNGDAQWLNRLQRNNFHDLYNKVSEQRVLQRSIEEMLVYPQYLFSMVTTPSNAQGAIDVVVINICCHEKSVSHDGWFVVEEWKCGQAPVEEFEFPVILSRITVDDVSSIRNLTMGWKASPRHLDEIFRKQCQVQVIDVVIPLSIAIHVEQVSICERVMGELEALNLGPFGTTCTFFSYLSNGIGYFYSIKDIPSMITAGASQEVMAGQYALPARTLALSETAKALFSPVIFPSTKSIESSWKCYWIVWDRYLFRYNSQGQHAATFDLHNHCMLECSDNMHQIALRSIMPLEIYEALYPQYKCASVATVSTAVTSAAKGSSSFSSWRRRFSSSDTANKEGSVGMTDLVFSNFSEMAFLQAWRNQLREFELTVRVCLGVPRDLLGIFEKQGRIRKTWRERLFQLSGGYLQYFAFKIVSSAADFNREKYQYIQQERVLESRLWSELQPTSIQPRGSFHLSHCIVEEFSTRGAERFFMLVIRKVRPDDEIQFYHKPLFPRAYKVRKSIGKSIRLSVVKDERNSCFTPNIASIDCSGKIGFEYYLSFQNAETMKAWKDCIHQHIQYADVVISNINSSDI